MSANFNKVLIMGNLTRDPELRYIPSGQPVTNFSIAVNRVYNDQNGEKKEDTTFVKVVAWRRLAEICNEYLRKGSSVFVEGRLQSRSWQAQDGTKRSTIEIIAENVQFLSRANAARKEGNSSYGQASPVVNSGTDTMITDDSFPVNNVGGQSNGGSSDEEVPF